MNTTFMPALAAGQLGIDWGALTSVINVQTPNDRGRTTGTGSGIGSGSGLSVYLPTPPPPPPAPGRSTVQSVASGINSRLNWDQIFGLGSQAIQAFGTRPSTQIGGLTVRAIQPPQEQPASTGQPQSGGQPQRAAYERLADGSLLRTADNVIVNEDGSPRTAGAGVGQGIDGLSNWISKNPFLVGGALLGAWLLFKQPPGRR
ncbi:MAG TPA: hypothetical protein VF692_07355 [Pyrinomonadaceae bacterium]|jgi:hypothetical protein